MTSNYKERDLVANKSIAKGDTDDQSNLFVSGTTFYSAKSSFSKENSK